MTIKNLSGRQKELRRRIIEISYQANFSHLGSCLSAVDLIDAIYEIKNKKDKFVLSNGHAAVAWYAVLEKYKLINNSNYCKKLHVHPDRNTNFDIHVSTGSLGHGLPIALGLALANPRTNIYCMISDGECSEGSIWETLRIAIERKILNLKIILNANGWGAYGPISPNPLVKKLKGFGWHVVKVKGHNINSIKKALTKRIDKPTIIFAQTTVEQLPFLKNQDAHYHVMNKSEYQQAMEILK